MKTGLRGMVPPLTDYLDDRIVRWRTGTHEGQLAVLAALIVLNILVLVGSLVQYSVLPAASFIVPMLLGSITLRFRPLATLFAFTGLCVALAVTAESLREGMAAGRIATLVMMAIVAAIILFDASRRRSGLPGTLGEAMLVDLNDRLQAQGVVPPLPPGWRSQSAMRSAGGAKFAGDFLVASLTEDETSLEMVLVDVCGKGVAAGTQSLQLAGALGGLIGSLPPLGLFAAANDYLLRQRWDDGFATAAHVLIRLDTGEYSIISAGHPPVLRWHDDRSAWEPDGARGIALGIMRRPEFHRTAGVLQRGDALMFYTDGVVESRTQDVMAGIEWLRETAAQVVQAGFEDAPRRILRHVESTDDDRAVLVLRREP